MINTAFRQVVACHPAPPEDATHRYRLEISLTPDSSVATSKSLGVIMKNPSKAGLYRSDPTIGKLEAWARRCNFNQLVIVNLFALRSTDPQGVNVVNYLEAVGSANDEFICQLASQCQAVIAGWGNPNGIEPARYYQRISEVCQLLQNNQLWQVGRLTKLGHPRACPGLERGRHATF